MSEQIGEKSEGTYDLQVQYLLMRQQEISARFFEAGITSRIVASIGAQDGKTSDLSGFPEYEKIFVPSMYTRKTDGGSEQLISLAAMAIEADGTRACTLLRVCQVDPFDIIDPCDGITLEDAEAVYNAALDLAQLREDHILPGLHRNLLFIPSAAPSEANS